MASARQALEQRDYGQALDLDPANLDAARVNGQALRGEDDETKYKQASNELSRGSPEGIKAALRFFQGMSADSASRAKLATPLSAKLVEGGQDSCRRKLYHDCATWLCQAYQVAPAAEKPNAQIIKTMHDAEKKAHMNAMCVLR